MNTEQDAAKDEAREAILASIKKQAIDLNEHHAVSASEGLRNLAEAYAWVTSPAQPH
jgi:hypothetical protein